MRSFVSRRFVTLLLAVILSLFVVTACAEEYVLVDNNDITVRIQEISEDPIWGHIMKLYLENKTSKQLMYSINNCAVNGVMNDPVWAAELMAGSKSNEQVTWMQLNGNANSVGITKLDFDFRVYDSEDWTSDALFEQNFTLYPQGENNVQMDNYTPGSGDVVLFNNNDAAMVVRGFRNDELWGYTADVYLLNKTQTPLMFSVDGATINGFMCDPFWASEVRAGASDYASISWLQSELDANGISDIQEVVLSIRVYNSDNWMADAVVEQQFTLHP